MGRRRRRKKASSGASIEAKPRSKWTESEVMREIRDWCAANGVRGYFKIRPGATLCGLFLAPLEDLRYGRTGRGEQLYHTGYTRLYAVSREKMKEFFSRENLACGNAGSTLSVGVPRRDRSKPIDNSEAVPYDPNGPSPLAIDGLTQGHSGAVYVPKGTSRLSKDAFASERSINFGGALRRGDVAPCVTKAGKEARSRP